MNVKKISKKGSKASSKNIPGPIVTKRMTFSLIMLIIEFPRLDDPREEGSRFGHFSGFLLDFPIFIYW